MYNKFTDNITPIAVQNLFDQLIRQMSSQRERAAITDIYTNNFVDPALGTYNIRQIRDHLATEPSQLFALVSLLLHLPDSFLGSEKRTKLSSLFTISLSDNEIISVTETGVWISRLSLGMQEMRLNRYEYHTIDTTSEIVTSAIYDYLKSAVVCFHAGLLPSALALTAIAFEACLRDVLTGIQRNTLPQQPAFKKSLARIHAHRDSEKGTPVLSFSVRNAAQSIDDYFSSMSSKGKDNFLGCLNLHLFREEPIVLPPGSASPGKTTLRVTIDTNCIDFLSTDQRETTSKSQPARKFSEFLRAAELAGRLKVRSLPFESAEVIRKARNNLVHWSDDALAEQLSGGMTLEQFIHDQDAVRTTLVRVADFISDEFYALREYERTGVI